MNEMTMNSACMYDEVEEIRNLNRVEGFDPRKYMRLIQNEGRRRNTTLTWPTASSGSA